MSEEYCAHEETGKYHHLRVVSDHDAENPRNDCNFGIMACVKHRNYELGDKEFTFSDGEEFMNNLAQEIDPTFEDTKDYWESGLGWQQCQNKHPGDFRAAGKMADERILARRSKILAKAVILPLYLYDHSGISMRTNTSYPFNCPWDAGGAGIIYATPAMIREEYSCKTITKDRRNKVADLLQSEVETYDMYLTGDVYGCVIEDMYGDEVDACWGFFGSEYAKEEGRDMLKFRDTKGRAKFNDSTFDAMRAHEADLRKQFKLLRDNCADINPITLAGMLEKAASLQKQRMQHRNDAVSDHFAEGN